MNTSHFIRRLMSVFNNNSNNNGMQLTLKYVNSIFIQFPSVFPGNYNDSGCYSGETHVISVQSSVTVERKSERIELN